MLAGDVGGAEGERAAHVVGSPAAAGEARGAPWRSRQSGAGGIFTRDPLIRIATINRDPNIFRKPPNRTHSFAAITLAGAGARRAPEAGHLQKLEDKCNAVSLPPPSRHHLEKEDEAGGGGEVNGDERETAGARCRRMWEEHKRDSERFLIQFCIIRSSSYQVRFTEAKP